MDFFSPLFVSSALIVLGSTVYGTQGPTDAVERRFTAVTHFPEIVDLYNRLRAEEQSTRVEDETTTPDMKDRVCRDISESGYFMLRKDEPIDMTKAYSKMKNLPKNVYESKFKLYDAILDGYHRTPYGLAKKYTHPTFEMWSTNRKEYMTVCLTRHRGMGEPDVNFVTDAYNVNNALELPKEERGYIAARFVFRNAYDTGTLIALAEEPAEVDFSRPQAKVKELYLEMRKHYESTKEEYEDPLCKLDTSQKLRVCASLMNSSFLDHAVRYIPNYDRFDDKCHKRNVPLHTEPQRAPFKEWMLSCTVELIGDVDESDDSRRKPQTATYSASRAYNSHMAFIYDCSEATGNCYPINIGKNISVILDRCHYPHCIEI